MTPLWRLVAVVAMFGGLGAVGYYLDVIGHAEDAATILSVAVRESQGDIRQWVQNRTLLASVMVAICYGIGLVLVKHAVLSGLRRLWSPWLAVAGGCVVGALVVAPEFWRQLMIGGRRR